MIGGPFTLVDHTGRQVTEETLKGKWSLIYFGYTYCPDVCPTPLSVMSQALDELGPLADRVTPVFVQVGTDSATVHPLAPYQPRPPTKFLLSTGKHIGRA